MINRFEKLAKLVVEYSLNVKKGQRIWIKGPPITKELIQALYVEIIKAGAHPWFIVKLEGIHEIFLKHASEEQLLFVDNLEKQIIKEFDGLVSIQAEYNTRNLSSIDPAIIAKYKSAPDRFELDKIFDERFANGELKWVAVPFPCNSLAQEANMDLFSYSEFVEKALLLDKDNPVEEWKNIDRKQARIVDYLNKVESIHVIGEDTDLTLSVKDRIWINCSGKENLPDGEIFTGPIEDSVNGHIRFTYPGIYSGQEIENIYLEFKNGEVINATADKGEPLLHELLKIDGAKRMGEFAVGTNYEIKNFTKNMLFDEKMGGTMHCAIGMGFKETGSKNECAVHWDILKDMKLPGSKIFADDKLIYEEGNWKI